ILYPFSRFSSCCCQHHPFLPSFMSLVIILEPALQWSGALRRKLGANNAFKQWLLSAIEQPVSPDTIHAWFDELRPGDAGAQLASPEIRKVLRQLRERVFFTIMVRDINGCANLPEVVTAMSALAD